MRPTTTHVPPILAALAILGLGGVPAACAGPATYDKDRRSFHLRYTFAEVPSFGSFEGVRLAKATPDQERDVRAWLARASDVLYVITGKRARLGPVESVDSVEGADLLISVTGQPISATWSTMKAIGGRPGHCVVYYHSVKQLAEADAVPELVHNFSHYFFGMADEYIYENFPGGCPADVDAPGCLMDNYLTTGPRGGWSVFDGYCDNTNHNSQRAQPQSCQAIVDKFFEEYGNPPKVIDCAVPAFRKARQETIAEVRAYAQVQLRDKPTLPLDPVELRTRAETSLRDRLRKAGIAPPKEEVDLAVARIAGLITGRPRAVDESWIDARLKDQLRSKARELAARYPEGPEYPPSTRRMIIRKQLFVIALGLSGGFLPPARRRIIEQIVEDALKERKSTDARPAPAQAR
jgi:hypothetical protein